MFTFSDYWLEEAVEAEVELLLLMKVGREESPEELSTVTKSKRYNDDLDEIPGFWTKFLKGNLDSQTLAF